MSKNSQIRDGAIAAAVVAFSIHAGSATAQAESQTETPAPAEAAAEVTAEPIAEAAPAAAAEVTPYAGTVPVDVAAAPPEEPKEAKGASRFMEEIVVTAQKREENLQEVPISVQAFSAELLDAKGIDEPKALQLTTPGLQYNVFAGYSLIYIRGVGTDAFIPSADASVATYIDNVYYPFAHGLASSLGSIERVEVLKGPQGTLFGRNSTGGAINIVTRQPGPDFESNVLISRESYDKTNVRAYTNIPLTETFAISVSGLSYTEESYYKVAASSPKTSLPDETSRAFSVKAGWRPIDDLSATIGYSYINSRGAFPMSLTVDSVKPAGLALGVQKERDYETGEDATTYIDSRSRVVTADIKYTAPWFDLRLIGGDQDITSPALADYDGSKAALTTFEAIGQFAKVRTGEFQIISNADSFGAEWLKFIGGVYYIDSTAGYDPLKFTAAPGVLDYLRNPPPGGLFDALNGATLPLITGLESLSAAVGIPLADALDNGIGLNLQGVLDTQSTAYFAQATADITDWMALTLGGRYQTETRTLAKSTTRVVNPFNPNEILPVEIDFNSAAFGYDGPRKADSSNFSPKAVLDFKPWDNQLLYASYSKGFKSGTFNIIAIYAPTQYVEPEEVTSYELGYKGTLLDGAMRFNTAVFFNQIDNLQVQTISLTSGGAVRFETAGGAEIKGIDFDMTWQIFPDALPGLVVTAAGAYLDGEYSDYDNGSGFDPVTGLAFGGTGLVLGGGVTAGRDFTGNKLVRTPEFSGNAGLSYTFDIGDGTIEMASDVYYNSGSYFTAQNLKTSEEQAYELVNARVSYLYNPWNLRATLFGKNINDAQYHYVIAELDFGTAKVLAPPATYGVKLQWDFK